MINKELLEKYKNHLEKTQAQIESELEDLKKTTDFGSDRVDQDEESDETEEMSNVLSIQTTLKQRLENIDRALGKIKNGSYGACENCGKDIEPAILDIAPESKICKDCKQSK